MIFQKHTMAVILGADKSFQGFDEIIVDGKKSGFILCVM